MTAETPPAGGDPYPFDIEAALQLERNDAGRLELVRARAEKWVGGLAALSGVVTTAFVVKGKESVSDVQPADRNTVGRLLIVALFCLAIGTYRAYRAAYGDPGKVDQIEPRPLADLHAKLLDARRTAATKALSNLRWASRFVLVAITCMTVAVAFTWFAPTDNSEKQDDVCMYFGDKLVVRLASESVVVKETGPDVKVGRCS